MSSFMASTIVARFILAVFALAALSHAQIAGMKISQATTPTPAENDAGPKPISTWKFPLAFSNPLPPPPPLPLEKTKARLPNPSIGPEKFRGVLVGRAWYTCGEEKVKENGKEIRKEKLIYMGIAESKVYEIGSLYYTDRKKYDRLASPDIIALAGLEMVEKQNPDTGNMDDVEEMNFDAFLGPERHVAYFRGERDNDGTSRDAMYRWGGDVPRERTVLGAIPKPPKKVPPKPQPILKRQAQPGGRLEDNPAYKNFLQATKDNLDPTLLRGLDIGGNVKNQDQGTAATQKSKVALGTAPQGTAGKPKVAVNNVPQGTTGNQKVALANTAQGRTGDSKVALANLAQLPPGQMSPEQIPPTQPKGSGTGAPPRGQPMPDPNEGRAFPIPKRKEMTKAQREEAKRKNDGYTPSDDGVTLWAGNGLHSTLAPGRYDFPWAHYPGAAAEGYRFDTVGGVPRDCETSGYYDNDPTSFRNRWSVPIVMKIAIFRPGCAPGMTDKEFSPPLAFSPLTQGMNDKCKREFPKVYGDAAAGALGMGGQRAGRIPNGFRKQPMTG
ncbi:MAG: hypothetical protein M1823_000374 [Watsoniomyces obsoletus]|nr:MAG: hypothetical protein M1823_000374 [Watsoniomyces obsoletus]